MTAARSNARKRKRVTRRARARALPEWLTAPLELGRCWVCLCTDEHACAGGCNWTDATATLCDQCSRVVERLLELGDEASMRLIFMVAARTTTAPLVLERASATAGISTANTREYPELLHAKKRARAVLRHVRATTRRRLDSAAAAYMHSVASGATLGSHGRSTPNKSKAGGASRKRRSRAAELAGVPVELVKALAADHVAAELGKRARRRSSSAP